jgi:predicted permease
VTIPGYTPQPDERMGALLNRVSPRYFETIGTRVLAGRVFDDHDTPRSQRVIVVNDAFAQLHFRNQSPIGKTVSIDSDEKESPLEIVGLVESTKYDEPREPLRPMIFLPLLQTDPTHSPASSDYRSNFIGAIEVRSVGEPVAIAGLVRRALTEIDPDLPVLRVETLSERVGQTLSQDRTVATLAGGFGLLALALTSIGLYGLMAYLVQRRTSEIGIRMALGASRGNVVGMVVREALAQAAVGIAAGIPVAFVVLRLIASQLYGVSPSDPQHAMIAAVILVACLGVAGYLPARRAARIDPLRALRTE